jgi:hypothetical protein
MDRLYRLIELLPSLPLWGGDQQLPLAIDSPLPVQATLQTSEVPEPSMTKIGLSPLELELLIEADCLAGPVTLPPELLPPERWLGPSAEQAPPKAWWCLGLPIIGPAGTWLSIELCTPVDTHQLRFFSPRAGTLQRLD